MSSSKKKETDDEIHGPARKSVTHRWGAPEERLLSEQELLQLLQAELMDAQIQLSRARVARGGASLPSCLSMKRDRSMDLRHHFRGKSTRRKRVRVARGGPPKSRRLSKKSDNSMGHQIDFRREVTVHQRYK